MCVPCAERVILSASEGPQQCPSLPCGLKLFSPPSILLFLALAGYTFLETALVVRNFNQVLVWVTKIDGAHFPHCAVPFDGAFFDANFLFVQVANHLIERG